MNLRQIREECWAQARDAAEADVDKLWPTKEMDRYINRVYRFIARETQCIKDSTTAAVCLIDVDPVDYTTYAAGTLDYIWANDSDDWLYQKDVTPYLLTLHTSILQIDICKWMSQPWALRKVSYRKWEVNPWWFKVIGQPTEYAQDLETGKIALNYRTESADKLHLHVRRMPLTDLAADSDVPEFHIQYHDFMINGIMMWMYRKRDAETLDEAKATEFETAFLRDVDEIKQQVSQKEEHLRPNQALSAFL